MSIALKCWDEPNHKCPSKTCYNDRKDETYYTVSPYSNLSVLIKTIPSNSSGWLRISPFNYHTDLSQTYPITPLYRGQYLNLTTPLWDDSRIYKEVLFRIHLNPSPNLPPSASFQSTYIILASNNGRFECEQRDSRGIGTILSVGIISTVFLELLCCFGCFRLWKVARKRTLTKRMYLGLGGLGIGYYICVMYGLYRVSIKRNGCWATSMTSKLRPLRSFGCRRPLGYFHALRTLFVR